ncbi:MAG: FAD binding domain-containing protein [Bacillota bacterium]
MSVQHYVFPETIAECLQEMNRFHGQGRLIAGGTDLMIWLRKKKVAPVALIDVTRIAELNQLEIKDGNLLIGAAVTHAQVAAHAGMRALLHVLAEACNSVGSPQIRNIATVVGNVVSAQPAGDAAVALVALNARARIVSAEGSRVEPVEELYAGVGRSKIDSTRELVTLVEVLLPGPGSGSAFLRIAPRNALALPVVNVAAVVTVADGKISAARLAAGPMGEKPFRPRRAEEFLVGTDVREQTAWEEAGALAAREANPRDSLLRGSSLYRKHLLQVLTRRALQSAVARALERQE